MSVFDVLRPGAPEIVSTENNVTQVHDLALTNYRLKVLVIAEVVGISKDRVMKPLIHIRDQETVTAVNLTRRTYSEKGEDCSIGRKADGDHFLGFYQVSL